MLSQIKIINLNIITKYLYYLFVFLLPLQTRWIFLDSKITFQQLSLYGFDVVLILFLILDVCSGFKPGIFNRLKKLKFSYRNSLPVVSFLLFVVYSLFSIIWSPYKTLALFWIVRLLLAVNLVFYLRFIRLNFKKLAWILLVAITIQALIGMGQFLLQDDLVVTKWLGASAQEASFLGTSVIETDTGRWLRAHGTQPHPNILGGLVVVGLILTTFLLSNSKFETLNPKQISNNKFQITFPKEFQIINHGSKERSKFLILDSILLILTATLLFTFSRSAWLALAIIAAVWLLKSNNLKSFFLNIKSITAAIILIAMLTLTYWPLVSSRLASDTRLEQISLTQRQGQFNQAYALLQTNPSLGVGLGNYTVALARQNPQLNYYQLQPVHNIYWLILTELGIIGLLIFLFILFVIFKYLIQIRDSRFEIRKNLQLTLTAILIIGFFDHYFWTLPSMFYLFWLITGFLFVPRLKI